MAHIKSIKKIYSDGRHNAFTDMEYWKGYYYVVFRNANGHARLGPVEVQGRIIVIRSRDLVEWDVCAQISTDGDDRDPSLLDLGEELGVYFFSEIPKEPGQVLYEKAIACQQVQSHAAFSSDGTSWSSPLPVCEGNFALWKVERLGDVFYAAIHGAVEHSGILTIACSTNGRDWETVSVIPAGFKLIETGLWITDDKVMHLVSRAWEHPDMAHLSRSEPPYKEWQVEELNYAVHCPVIRPVGDELWVAGRAFIEQLPPSMVPPDPSPEKIESLSRRDERLAKSPQDWHTAIWRLVGDQLEPILVLPSLGDCGYPGLVVEKDRILMSFYSQHDVDEGPDPRPGECANEIYLTEIGYGGC